MSKDIPESAKRAYRERLKYLRRGQESFQGKEISKAVQYYATYLKALSDYFGIAESHLDPKYFDLQNDKAELLLISQVYWDLSKSYDRSPGLQNEGQRCLNQFIKFTIGFKHQHINAQLLKKYVKNNSAVNQQAFKTALTKIHVDSKSCYIASYAYGENHHITEDLRFIKSNLLAFNSIGKKFIHTYYDYSPFLVSFCQRFPITGASLTLFIFKPLILLFRFILKRWSTRC